MVTVLMTLSDGPFVRILTERWWPGKVMRSPARAADTDNDGVFDPVDNCPEHPNADQVDFDSDGIGDTYDPSNTPQFTSSPIIDATTGIEYNYQLSVSDPDTGDGVAISLNTAATWLTLTSTGNGAATLTGTPTDTDVGSVEGSLDSTGVAAVDDVDGDVTDEIVATSNVNTAAAGTYSVMYDVSDSAGNAAATVRRTVNVSALGVGGGGGGGAIDFLQLGGLFALLRWRRRSTKTVKSGCRT